MSFNFPITNYKGQTFASAKEAVAHYAGVSVRAEVKPYGVQIDHKLPREGWCRITYANTEAEAWSDALAQILDLDGINPRYEFEAA